MTTSTAFSRRTALLLAAAACLGGSLPAQSTGLAARYQADANRLIDAATRDSAAWNRLAKMTDTFGNRLSGSTALEKTIDWILAAMKADGLQNVHGEPVMVPHWVRGAESATLISPRTKKLDMLGLGNSIGTPADGITADVVVVSDFDELHALGDKVKGKIVVFDAPFVTYGETVRYRSSGVVEAAKQGAVAAIVRSITPQSLSTPHTGALRYDTTVKKIPGAAITVEDAELLHRMQARGDRITLKLVMHARMLPDAPSRNIVAEIVGSEKPNEVIVLGGHIDSWDVGQGAMDDGGGSVAAWEAVRLMKVLGLKPKRTVRVVLWTNEENGGRGGVAYRAAHANEVANHMVAMESDNGVFAPRGVRVVGGDSTLAVVRQIASLLRRIGADSTAFGGGESDIGPLLEAGVPGLALDVDGSKYFWYHHTNADMMEAVNPNDIARCVAVMAVLAYVVADMPEPLPRGATPR